MNKFFAYTLLLMDSFYKSIIKNHLGHGCCRHQPSCSAYVQQCFLEQPLYKAIYFSSKRLLSCQPWVTSKESQGSPSRT